ncbi:hypothetical protein [Streptomyces sp. BE133]|uniref:hypothetical protein n=1 Tax=Streptomyces sp. BE133 TaxID=3002523 RepID=UPI002E7A86DE|nr:hypothetical protein [Streptomyces sp. BE133]MEE1806156.1 hypothetical protein [Streptomyces sp. BE133]
MLLYLTRGQVAVGAALALPPVVCAVLVPVRLAARARELKVIALTDDDYLAQIHHTARLAETSTSAG